MKLEYSLTEIKRTNHLVQYEIKKDGFYCGLICLDDPYNNEKIKLKKLTMEEK